MCVEADIHPTSIPPPLQGKYLEIQFNAQGEPVGAVITNYLLEKVAVISEHIGTCCSILQRL